MNAQANLPVVSTASAGALLMDNTSMDRLDRLADFMVSGKATVPQHLRGSKGDCFAIALQSMQWGMNPFAVAQKTHLVNGVLGYEAQLVAAVINNSGLVKDRFNFEWFGDWDKIVGRFKEVTSSTKKDDNGNAKKYIVPDWKQTDEVGLGVKVWATLRGEAQPRVLTLLMTQARTRNSTLWTEDPKQQIAYLAQKRWARLHAPDVILGVYTADELQPPGEVFMGHADVVQPDGGSSAGADAADARPTEPAGYPQADFDKNLDAWAKVVSTGRKTMDQMVAMAESKGKLSDAQKQALGAAVELMTANVTDATPKNAAAPAAGAPTVNPDELVKKIADANSLDKVYELGGLIEAITDDAQRERAAAVFEARVAAMKDKE